jgi:hypothetical protein
MKADTKDNILKILGVEAREDVISNLIAYALTASKSFRSIFLRSVCGQDAKAYRSLAAFTRISVGEPGIPDLIIVALKDGSVDLIVIENKLKAEEGEDQTKSYASDACSERLRTILNLQGTVNLRFVFLTLFPDQVAEDEHFASANYAQLHEALKTYEPGESSTADGLVADLDSLLGEFYKCAQLSPSDLVLERLKEQRSLDGSYLYFRSFLRKIPLPGSLVLERFFKASALGRRYYYYDAQISKDSWHPEECPELSQFNPRKHFNIHFEPQYAVLSGTFSLYLHYEINPYETKRVAQQQIAPSAYSEHEELRAVFADHLRSAKMPGLRVGGRSNQVARVDLDFQGKNVQESVELTKRVFDLAVPVIDKTIVETLLSGGCRKSVA